ncbi:MAG: Rab family GTPase [Promethearchaeota archaeon]|jgi:Ras-related protein Rab-23
MNEAKKFGFKITVIGAGGVGKTSLIKKFTKGTFDTNYVKTIGAQFSEYEKEIGRDKIRLILWDIAGQDDFHFLRPSFYEESRAAIIVFSLEENELGQRSFQNITHWQKEVNQHCGNIPVVIFANKVDLVDEENIREASLQKTIENQNYLGFFLTSAKTGKGVNQAFNSIINELYHKSQTLSS